MDIDKIVSEFHDDAELATWYLTRLATEEGRRTLTNLREHFQIEQEVYRTLLLNAHTASSPTDYVSITAATSTADLKAIIEKPTTIGLPSDAIFVGCYRPARVAATFEVGFYGVGQNIVLVSVNGYPPDNENVLARAVGHLGGKNIVNFQATASGNRADRMYIHNEIQDHANVSRSDSADVAVAMICWPQLLSEKLVGRGYSYVETNQPPADWPTSPSNGTAKIEIQSSCPRPPLGFILQMAAGGGTPVCVTAPSRNNNPERSPSGTASIYIMPEIQVLKVYPKP